MKKGVVRGLLLLVTAGYFQGCYYLLVAIEKDHEVSKKRDSSMWNAMDAKCVCPATYDNFSYVRKPWEDFQIPGGASLPTEVCKSKAAAQNHISDISTYEVLNSMKIKYPKYVWTHTGWNQQLDSTYDQHSWDSEPLQVLVVPFSHHDPGWKSTMSSYYNSWTKGTLNVAVKKLLADPKMRFVWSEVVFLQRWFEEMSSSDKEKFMKVLSSGQFEILTGGWVMTDEAVAHFSAMIDQLVEGQQFLKNKFNYTVKHAWAIDPFGHSSTVPYLLKKSGIQDMLIQRVHYAMKQYLAERQNLEFYWRQSWSGSEDTDMFCHLTPFMLYNIVYSCGPDIQVCCWMDFSKNKCWKWGKYQEPESINDENVETKSWELLDQLRKKAQFYQHNIVLLPHGDDFRFSSEAKWDEHFNNLNKLFKYMNSNKDMHVSIRYATVGEYFETVSKTKATQKELNQNFPVLSGDFFTYTDRDDQYWSGYYSTRPILKYMIRHLQARLRSAEILFTTGLIHSVRNKDNGATSKLADGYKQLTLTRQTHGLLQHHDAITGTATRSVVKDYLERANSALRNVNKLLNTIVSNVLLGKAAKEKDNFFVLEDQRSWNLPPNQPPISASSSILFFNSLGRERTEVVKIPVISAYIQINDHEDRPILCQVNPIIKKNLVVDENKYHVFFPIVVPPFGFSRYTVKVLDTEREESCKLAEINFHSAQHNHDRQSPFKTSWSGMRDYEIQNDQIKINFCECNGLMSSVYMKATKSLHKCESSFITYKTGLWWNPLKDKSGAYVFIPDGKAVELPFKAVNVAVVTGDLLSFVYTEAPLATQIVTLYNTSDLQDFGIHIENRVDITKRNNTEIGLRLKTDVYNSDDSIFYTDLNGFQFVKRKTQSRLPIQANFYPMTTHFFMESLKTRATLHSFQSHGVASLEPGWFEVILDRRLSQDDWRGLNQGVTDNIENTISHFILTFEQKQSTRETSLNAFPSLVSHKISSALTNPFLVFQSKGTGDNIPFFIPISQALPCDLDILNIRYLGDRVNPHRISFLIMLHRLGIDCDIASQSSIKCEFQNEKASFKDLFSDFNMGDFTETDLTGIRPKAISQAEEFYASFDSCEIKAFVFSPKFD